MFHDSMNKLEKALDQLNIKQQGYRVETTEAWNIVKFWHGAPWVRIEKDWINGVISDQDFLEQAVVLINQFADHHKLKRPEVA